MTLGEVLERLRPEFEKRAEPYSHKSSALLALLHAVQEEYGFVPPEAEEAVAIFLGIGSNKVHEAATFYSNFRRRPLGMYHMKICRTLSCDLAGAREILAVIERRLGITEGQVTPDGRFSFETAECLGCCDKAPALHVNGEHYSGPVTAESVTRLIGELAAREDGEADG